MVNEKCEKCIKTLGHFHPIVVKVMHAKLKYASSIAHLATT